MYNFYELSANSEEIANFINYQDQITDLAILMNLIEN